MVVAAGPNYQAQLSLTKMLHELIGNFNKNAGQKVKRIVQDLQQGGLKFKALSKLSPRLQVFFNAYSDDSNGQLPLTNTLCYLTEDGLLIKMCPFGEKAPNTKAESMKVWQKTLKSAAMPFKRKLYARELLSLDTLFEAIYITSSVESKVRIRIPLCC